jgi:hypothetical protein
MWLAAVPKVRRRLTAAIHDGGLFAPIIAGLAA